MSQGRSNFPTMGASPTLVPPRPGVNGLLLVALAALFWSTGGAIVRSLSVTDPWTISFWRSLFAMLVLSGFVVTRQRARTVQAFRAVGWPGILVGGCFATASLLFVVAMSLTSVANTLVILATTPFFAALFSRLFLRERVSGLHWLAMAVAVAGVGYMVRGSVGSSSLLGDAVAFVMPVVFALATVILRRSHMVPMAPAMALGPLIGLAVSGLLAPSLVVSGSDLVLLAVFGAIQLGTGLAIFEVGARRAPAAEVALVSLLETVLGPLWVWWLAGERPTNAALVGGSVVVMAIAATASADIWRRVSGARLAI